MGDRTSTISLSKRLLLSASLALILFLGMTGVVLDRAFHENSTTAVRDRLQATVYTLLAAADVIEDDLFVPDDLPEPRLSRPGSGLYAQIRSSEPQWRSLSALDVSLPLPEETLEAGEFEFHSPAGSGEETLFILHLGVVWETGEGQAQRYIITIGEDSRNFREQISGFRQALWGWLISASVLFLLVQWVSLRWSLRPLRKVSEELQQVEMGEKSSLQGAYPREIVGLTENLNRFIGSERRHLDRYRHSLSDLAHSLKTPLAVLRSMLESGKADATGSDPITQLERMDDIVAYQLQRARTSGHLTFSRGIAVEPLATRVVESLEQVHRDKQVQCEFDLEQGVLFFGDEGDLLELLGNLLENAFKWCHRQVLLTVHSLQDDSHTTSARIRTGLELRVEDDGPGISESAAQIVLQRGVRMDETVTGHGIGLAIVRDIVAEHDGSLAIERSELGGARMRITLP